jgi:hypothetical protein
VNTTPGCNARKEVMYRSPITPTWKLVSILASSIPPLSVTETLARFTPPLRIADDFWASAVNRKQITAARLKIHFVFFIIVRFYYAVA